MLGLSVLPTLRVRLGQRPKNNGSPTLVYVAGAALRVADIVSDCAYWGFHLIFLADQGTQDQDTAR